MQTFKIELSELMLNYVLNSLANMPYRDSAPVIAEIQKQCAQPQEANDE